MVCLLCLRCARGLPGGERRCWGAACHGHHTNIRLCDTGGAHAAWLKRDAHLQCAAGSVCSTSHAGLLASVASGAPEAAWVAGEPPETRLHTRVAVVFVECSSRTRPKSWQLCRKCSQPATL